MTAQAARPPFPESRGLLREIGWIPGVGDPGAEEPNGDQPLCISFTSSGECRLVANALPFRHRVAGRRCPDFLLDAFMPRTKLRRSREFVVKTLRSKKKPNIPDRLECWGSPQRSS